MGADLTWGRFDLGPIWLGADLTLGRFGLGPIWPVTGFSCLSTSGVRSPPGRNDLVSFCHYLAFIVVRPSDLSYILMKDRAYITVV
jgi:hypothetical protein